VKETLYHLAVDVKITDKDPQSGPIRWV